MSKSKAIHWILFVLAFMLPGIIIFYFHNKVPFIFQTNDDVFFNAIISGEITGSPCPKMIYIGYPVGILLTVLYNLFPSIPWYGVFLCTCMALTMSVVLLKMMRFCGNIWLQLLTICLCTLGIYSFLFLHITQLQFTFVTAFVGAGALFLLANFEANDSLTKSVKGCLGFYLLSALSCSIRDKAYIILLPFVCMLFVTKYLYTEENGQKLSPLHLNKTRKNLFYIALIYFGILASILCIQKVSTSSDEWATFIEYTSKNDSLIDYDGYPDYNTHKEFYDSIGITKNSYVAFSQHFGLIFEKELNLENLIQMAEISKAENRLTAETLPDKINHMVSQFVERHLNYADRPLNLLVYAFYILFFVNAIIGRKKRAVWEILLTGIARMIIWSYLMYIERYPTRVTQGVYIAELLILLGISWKNKLWEGVIHKKATRTFWCITLVIFVGISVRFGIPKAIGAGYESRGRLVYSQSYIDMKDYFKAHPENFYYLDTNSFGNFTREALSTGREEYGNFMFTGSWLPKSPLYEEKLRREGITDVTAALFEDPHVYIVFMDNEMTDYEYLSTLYREDYNGRELKTVEDVTTSNGLVFHIMKVCNPN